MPLLKILMERIYFRRIMMRQSGKRQQMQHTRSLMAILTNYITLMMIRMIIIMA